MIVSARSTQKLKEVVSELKGTFKVEADFIAADLATGLNDKVTQARFRELFESRNVSILVNNLGGPLVDMMNFVEIPPENFDLINNFNCGATYLLTQMALKQMIPRGKGRILNSGSMSSYGSPWLLPYGAEKAKLQAFSESLSMELTGTGVQVQTSLLAAMFSEAIAQYNGISGAPSSALFALQLIGLIAFFGILFRTIVGRSSLQRCGKEYLGSVRLRWALLCSLL